MKNLFGLLLFFTLTAQAADYAPLKTTLIPLANDSKQQVVLLLDPTSSKTLYTFDSDKENVSNCTGGCATTWPPVLVDKETAGGLKGDVTAFDRGDGTWQVAINKKPVYSYVSDTAVKQINGNYGKWHSAIVLQPAP